MAREQRWWLRFMINDREKALWDTPFAMGHSSEGVTQGLSGRFWT